MPENQIEKIQRLIEIRKLKKLSQQAMADILGIQRASLSKIENQKENRMLPNGTSYILEKELGINKVWFDTGVGDIENHQNAKLISSNPDTIELPLLTVSSRASFDYEAYQDESYEETANVYKSRTKGLKKPVLIDIEGDSMAPQLNDGTRVLADEINPNNWTYTTGVVAVSFREQFVVKRIRDNNSIETSTITLHSDNPKGGTFTVQMSDIKQMWRIIEIVKAKVE